MNIKVAKNRLIYSFIIINMIAGTAVGAFQLILPVYAHDLGANTMQLGLLRGIAGLGLLCTVLPAGILVDQYGARKLFLLGSLASGLVIMAMAFVPSSFFLLVLAGLEGVFRSMKFTALHATFFKYLTKLGLDKAGWFKGSMSIGLSFIGVLLGGFMIYRLSFSHILTVIFTITLIPLLLVPYLYKDNQVHKSVSHNSSIRLIVAQLRGFRTLLEQSLVKFALLTESLSAACFATFNTFFAVILVNKFSMTPVLISILLIAESAAYILTVFLAGRLIAQIKNKYFYLLSYFVSSGGLIGLSLGNDFLGLMISSIILGLGIGLSHVASTARIGEIKGQNGKLAGLFSTATGTGISVGPLLAGLMGQYFDDSLIFLGFVPLYILLGCAVAVGYWQDQKVIQEYG